MIWDRTTVWFVKIPVVYKSHDEDRRLAAIYALLDRYGLGHEIELKEIRTSKVQKMIDDAWRNADMPALYEMARIRNLKDRIASAESNVKLWKEIVSSASIKFEADDAKNRAHLADREKELVKLKAELLKPAIEATIGATGH